MKILFIGGTGIISSACSELVLARGHELYLLNRGLSFRPAPAAARILQGDINDRQAAQKALGEHKFDAVVDWIAFVPDQVRRDLDLFRGRTRQYVFISSASAYQKPPALLPVTESTPLHNPFWLYSRNKIACEMLLQDALRSESYPITIVRPSHTYDKTLLPFSGGYTNVARMRQGKPVVVHGDGTSLWTLTHHVDFAVGLVGLLGNNHALGETFHITSDESLPWDAIYMLVAQAAGVDQPRLVHLASESIARFDPDFGAGLLGDKAHSMVFDNTKIRRAVPDFQPRIPFHVGVQEILTWYDADPDRQKIDPEFDALQDRLANAALKIGPTA